MKTRLRNRHKEGLHCPKRIVLQKIQLFHHLVTLVMILVDFSSSVKHKRRCLWCFLFIQCKSILFQASCMDSHCMGKYSSSKYIILYFSFVKNSLNYWTDWVMFCMHLRPPPEFVCYSCHMHLGCHLQFFAWTGDFL